MIDPKKLLKYEYFPNELPPCFNSEDLSLHYDEIINELSGINIKTSIPLKFSGYKSETSRRVFSIPNPFHYCKIVKLLTDNKEEFSDLFNSPYSLSCPKKGVSDKNSPYKKRSNSILETKKEIEKCFLDNRYEIRLDINSFFDSIYTHSISWALHGLQYAKSHKNESDLLGNQIDSSLRALNDGQTNGILVGNSVSRIISEILLCKIDKDIKIHFPNVECCRFVDDYYIYTKDSLIIKEIISFIRNSLAKFELTLNENKIKISESPFLYGKPWIEKIKSYIHCSYDVFITNLIADYRIYNDISILKYGLKMLLIYDFKLEDWPSIQSRLINILVSFPSLADIIIKILTKYKNRIDKQKIKRAIYSIIDESILLNKEQELIWAIWFVKNFDIKISQKYIIKVLETSNDLSIIIMLSIIYKENRQKENKISEYLVKLRDDLEKYNFDYNGRNNMIMWSSRWLLSYEVTKNNWLCVNNTRFDLAKNNSFFKKLIDLDIMFYDCDYEYEIIDNESLKNDYITRKELNLVIKKMKREIKNSKLNNDLIDSSNNESSIDETFVERVINYIESESFYF